MCHRRTTTGAAISRFTWLRALVMSLLCLCSFTTQALSLPGTSGTGNLTLVEEAQVLQRIERAFHKSAGAIQQEYEFKIDAANQRQRITQATRDLAEDFLREAEKKINYLAGDGILGADEVSRDLGDLHDDYLGQLRQAYSAIQSGHPLPPRSRDFTDRTDYLKAMTLYTLNVRNTLTTWLSLLAAIAGGLLLAWLINLGLSKGAAALGKGHAWKERLLKAASGPLYVAALISGLYLASTWVWLPWSVENLLLRSLHIIYALSLFWYCWNIAPALGYGIAWLIQRTYGREIENHVTVVLARILRVLFMIIFVLFVINVLLESDITGLLATLGVIGIALSFVLKGSIENIAASFTIFGDKPFRIGDLILYNDEWGHIEDIGFRSTKLRTLDGHLINIPNAVLIEEALQNIGARPYIRRRFRIGLVYGTPPDKVREAIEILQDILKDHRGQPQDKPPHVVFEAYGDYDLRLLVQYYYQPADYWKALEFDSEVNLQILERFNASGIEFAFPTETVVLSSPDNDTPEIRLREEAPA